MEEGAVVAGLDLFQVLMSDSESPIILESKLYSGVSTLYLCCTLKSRFMYAEPPDGAVFRLLFHTSTTRGANTNNSINSRRDVTQVKVFYLEDSYWSWMAVAAVFWVLENVPRISHSDC